MRKHFVHFIFLVLFVCFSALGSTFNSDKYTKVSKDTLKVSPEKYKSKRIYFITKYFGLHPGLPRYMEKSGIKSTKYFLLNTKPLHFPVIAKKKNFEKIISGIKKFSAVTVYGRVKRFSFNPKWTVFPKYYLLLEHIEVSDEKINDDSDKTKNGTPKRPRRRFLRKIKPPPEW